MGDCRQEVRQRRIRPPLCAPCAWIRLRRHRSGAVASGVTADPAPPSSHMDPARVTTADLNVKSVHYTRHQDVSHENIPFNPGPPLTAS
uniref:Uncharacterized protein n=1 Tax=Oryza glumipatula TaxID=40148 RepID=A0A0E0A8J3_9ORYZ